LTPQLAEYRGLLPHTESKELQFVAKSGDERLQTRSELPKMTTDARKKQKGQTPDFESWRFVSMEVLSIESLSAAA
jgi:hypothetical protein